MSDTSVQTSAGPAASGVAAAPPPPRPAGAPSVRNKGPFVKALAALASLKLTVVLFVLCILLVFFGTLAQIDNGIWAVVTHYFRWWWCWVPLQIFFPRSLHVPGGFPYPGGWTLGVLLLANLFAAHLVRFKLSWKRAGIIIIHAGLIVLMISELITGVLASEGQMPVVTHESSNYIQDNEHMELAVVTPAAAEDGKDAVTVVPAARLRRGGLVSDGQLPFDVEVKQYMPNSDTPAAAEPGGDNPATAGLGRTNKAVPRPEGAGVDPEQRVDMPSAYVEFRAKDGGKSLGVYLLAATLPAQPVEADGQKYFVNLRPRRTYKPYTIHLLEFKHDVYPGTDIPKNYSSRVRLVDPSRGEAGREFLIKMNQPLRYQGETFYQSGTLDNDTGTVLQVVRNPGWLLPYASCVLVGGGMALHFGMSLITFLRRRVAA